ncbi:MAG: TolC family protein, partial [Candidatus Omnitrophota bacterium]
MKFPYGILAVVFLGLAGCLTVRLPEAKVTRSSEPVDVVWGGLVRQALMQNPDLQNARALVTSSRRSRDIAFGDYLPSVDGNLERGVSRNGGGSSGGTSSSSGTGGSDKTRESLSLGVSATQPIFNGFGTTGSWLKARKVLEASELSYLATSADVRYRLRASYVDLMRLARLVEVYERIAGRRKDNAELVRLRYDAGRENVGSALRAEAISSQAFFDVDSSKRRQESQALRLARESGGSFEVSIRVVEEMEKVMPEAAPASPDYARLSEDAPGVEQLLKTAEAAKAEIVTAQSSVWPQVEGNAQYGNTGTRAADLGNEGMLALKMSVPFFNGGKNVEGIAKAKADYDAAREAAESARDEKIAQLAEA